MDTAFVSDTPLYDRLIRAHAETGARPILTRSLDPHSGYDNGWSIKFVCGHRGTKNRWEYISGTTIEEAARRALDMRARAV